VNQFGFDLYAAEWIDFMPANFLNSTNPETIFVQKMLLIRQTAAGRYVLIGNELKISDLGNTSTQQIAKAELPEILELYFGLAY